MESNIVVALVAAGAALLGSIVGSVSALTLERLKARFAIRAQAEAALLAAVREFSEAAFAWFEWVEFMNWNERLSRDELLAENNERSRRRQAAYRQLALICSDRLQSWLVETYLPVEVAVRAHMVQPFVRDTERDEGEYRRARDRYEAMLNGDLVAALRVELRDTEYLKVGASDA